MLLRQTLRFLPAQVMGPLSQMAAAIVWTHWLGPDALGTYAIVWSVQELVGVAALYWWSSYVLRYGSAFASADDRVRLDATDLAVQAVAAVVQAMLAVGTLLLVLDQPPTPSLICATLAFTLTRNISTHLADRARSRFQALPYTLLQSVGSIGGLAIGIAALTQMAPTAEVLLWSYAIAQLVGFVVALPSMKLHWGRPTLHAAFLQAAWRYGAPLLVASVLVWAGNHAIRFIIEADLGMAAVGYMTVGWWLGLRLTMFASLLVTAASFSVAVERIREVGHRGALPQLATNSALLVAILLPSVVGVWLLNHGLAAFLVAAPYVPATMEILPMAVAAGAIRAFKNHGSDQCFLLFERTTLNIWSTIFEAGTTIVFCWIGLRLGGIEGAVAGCLAAAVLSTLVSLAAAYLMFGYHVRFTDLARIGLATGAMVLVLLLLPPASSLASLALQIGAGAIVYGIAIAALYPHPVQFLRGKLASGAR